MFDYFKTLNVKNFIFEIAIPIVVTIGVVVLELISTLNTSFFINNSINIVGVLLGFTLAVITFLVASDNENIKKTKEFKTQVKTISLYKVLVINYSYLIIVEGFICLGYLIGGLFYHSLPISVQLISKSIYILSVLHILFVTIRTSTDLYLVLSKEN